MALSLPNHRLPHPCPTPLSLSLSLCIPDGVEPEKQSWFYSESSWQENDDRTGCYCDITCRSLLIAICYETVGPNPKDGYFSASWRKWKEKHWARTDRGLVGSLAAWLLPWCNHRSSGLPLSLTALEAQPYQCPRAEHIWEGQLVTECWFLQKVVVKNLPF